MMKYLGTKHDTENFELLAMPLEQSVSAPEFNHNHSHMHHSDKPRAVPLHKKMFDDFTANVNPFTPPGKSKSTSRCLTGSHRIRNFTTNIPNFHRDINAQQEKDPTRRHGSS